MFLTGPSFTFRYRNVNDDKPDRSRAAGGSPESDCLREAMLAKAKVFEAQDAAAKIPDQLRNARVRHLLAHARGYLEALDRELTPFVYAQDEVGGPP